MDNEIEEWVHKAPECIHINFSRPSSTPNEPRIYNEPINAEYTIALFGEEEEILGYKEPKITLDFRANDLRPRIDIKYKQKVDVSALLAGSDREQVDIEKAFRAVMPESAFDAPTSSQSALPDATSKDWKPPGTRVHSFALQDKQYEIWSTSVADPAGLEIWRNMQVLVLLFVDGASPIELSEDWTYERWTLHLLYEVTPLEDTAVSPYTIAGFSTSHRYWIFPTLEVLRATNSLPSPPSSPNGDVKPQFPPRLELADNQESQFFKEHVDPLQLPSRERISQFLILPPYQGQSLGTRLYETIFNRYLKEQNVYEIAVEDPNVAFDAMRDYSDLVYLRKLPEFTNLTLAASLPPELLRKSAPIPRDQILGNGTDLTALRHKVKIVPRQFERMVELHLLSTLPPAHRNRARLTRKEKASNEDDRKYYFWRLAVKARIYRQNADTLDEMKDDPEQRVKILEDAVDRQLGEYEERLAEFERRQQWADGEEQDAGEGTARQGKRRPAGRGMKRSRVVEEEDEDDDWEDIESVASSKRTRV